MSYIREIWFPNREQSKVFKAIFILCLYATHSFIYVSNIKPLNTKRRLLYLKTQFVPRSKHFSSQL